MSSSASSDRIVALVGRSGAGVGALAASMRRVAGATGGHAGRGRVEASTLSWRGRHITLLDTPGAPDFVADQRSALVHADGALFVLRAVDGFDARLHLLWEECAAVGLPRAIVVTGLDRPDADIDETTALARRLFGEASIHPTWLPLLGDDEAMAGAISLFTGEIVDFSDGAPRRRSPEAVHLEGIADARSDLAETLVAVSEDDDLGDRFLSGVEIDDAAMQADMFASVAAGTFHPVLPVDPRADVAVELVLDLIADGFPSPADAEAPPASVDGEPAPPLSADADGPLAATAVDTGLVRVWSGTLVTGAAVIDGRTVHVHELNDLDGRVVAAVGAGGMARVRASIAIGPGRTIADAREPLIVEPPRREAPGMPLDAGRTADPARDALREAVDADPDAVLDVDPDTGRPTLWCTGDAHLAALTAGLDVSLAPVRFPLWDADGRATREPSEATRESVELVRIAFASPYRRPVLSDLERRRAETVDIADETGDRTVVTTWMPVADLIDYLGPLRAMTADSGSIERGERRRRPI